MYTLPGTCNSCKYTNYSIFHWKCINILETCESSLREQALSLSLKCCENPADVSIILSSWDDSSDEFDITSLSKRLGLGRILSVSRVGRLLVIVSRGTDYTDRNSLGVLRVVAAETRSRDGDSGVSYNIFRSQS